MKRFLRRYFSILRKERLPMYLISKSIKVSEDFRCINNIEELMKIHEKYARFLMDNLDSFSKYSPVRNSFLDLKIHICSLLMKKCRICERNCMINRFRELGFCKVEYVPRISSIFVHFWEEPWISPSLTIFFCGCNFKCVYCQNWEISQFPLNGSVYSLADLAKLIKRKENMVKNINFVGGDPTPSFFYVLLLLRVLDVPLPIVWNSNAYESKIVNDLLFGIVDVYLYDFKYGNDKCAERLSSVEMYWSTVTRNILSSYKRGGELSLRHLILPNHVICCSFKILEWVSKNLKNRRQYILNIMDQYYPTYKSFNFPEISRRISNEEYDLVVRKAKEMGINFYT